jgi:hypothetical protein
LFFKAANKNGTDVDKNNLVAYMQNNGIKLQCYFYLTDFVENKTAIIPDGLWTVLFCRKQNCYYLSMIDLLPPPT